MKSRKKNKNKIKNKTKEKKTLKCHTLLILKILRFKSCEQSNFEWKMNVTTITESLMDQK